MTQIDDIMATRQSPEGPFADCPREQLPERGIDRDRFDERPASVEKWVAGLPLANISAAGRELRGALQDLAATGLDPAPRVRVLQQLEPSIDYVCDALRKLYLHVPPPLPSRPRAAAELSLNLLEDMTKGYQLALVSGDAWRKLRKADRAAALYGTMRHCAATLVECWSLYQSPPPGCWELLHDSRRRARDAGINQRRIRRGKDTVRIDDLYRQVLLCAAAGPYQMGRGEALEAYRTLARIADSAHLLTPDDAQAAQSPFRVNPVEDDGPAPNIRASDEGAGDMLYLRTAGMVEEARRQLNGTGMLWWRKPPLPEDTAQRLYRLALSLGAVTERREPRQPDHKPASLVVGLSHVHRVLDAEDTKYFTSSRFQSHEGRPQEQALEVNDVWREIYSGDVLKAIDSRSADAGTEWVSDYSPESNEAENFWKLVNSSPGGFGLITVDREASRAQVGDLVLVNTSTGEGNIPDWRVGVIRWLRNSNGQGLQVGIEAIGSRPTPVFARAALGEGRYSEPSRCLLLPEDPEQETAETLIVPTLHYHDGQRVLIRGHERTGELELDAPVERTALFGRYTFRELEPTEGADHEGLWVDI